MAWQSLCGDMEPTKSFCTINRLTGEFSQGPAANIDGFGIDWEMIDGEWEGEVFPQRVADFFCSRSNCGFEYVDEEVQRDSMVSCFVWPMESCVVVCRLRLLLSVGHCTNLGKRGRRALLVGSAAAAASTV